MAGCPAKGYHRGLFALWDAPTTPKTNTFAPQRLIERLWKGNN
jgi:hypothetical protein